MSPRILIPTEDQEGSLVAGHFGRAPFFALFQIDESGMVTSSEVHPNRGSHRGGKGHAHDNVMALSPNVVIVNGMGPRGIRQFQDSNIAVLRANSNSTTLLLDAYSSGLLEELTEGCSDAHHK